MIYIPFCKYLMQSNINFHVVIFKKRAYNMCVLEYFYAFASGKKTVVCTLHIIYILCKKIIHCPYTVLPVTSQIHLAVQLNTSVE